MAYNYIINPNIDSASQLCWGNKPCYWNCQLDRCLISAGFTMWRISLACKWLESRAGITYVNDLVAWLIRWTSPQYDRDRKQMHTQVIKTSAICVDWPLLLYAYSYRFVSYKLIQFPVSSLSSCLRNKLHRISSLEIPAVEILIRPIHRPARQRDRTDHSQSVARLAQHQLPVSRFLNLHRDNCCRATLTLEEHLHPRKMADRR